MGCHVWRVGRNSRWTNNQLLTKLKALSLLFSVSSLLFSSTLFSAAAPTFRCTHSASVFFRGGLGSSPDVSECLLAWLALATTQPFSAMSSQSGITPTEGLVAQFHEFVASPHRALVLSIDPETLTIDITSTVHASADLDTDLSTISSTHLTPTECLYIILKHSNGASGNGSQHAFISYVPDNAPVKSKMLYASTKNTLLRSFSGGINFSPILFVNSADELSPEGWRKFVNSLESSAPLTESEIQLQKLKRDELTTAAAAAAAASKPSRLAADNNTNILFAIDPETEKALEVSDFTAGKLITLYIDTSCETLKLAKLSENVKENQLVDVLAEYTSSPAYHIYKNSNNETFFILTCPSGSKVRERMLYATNKQGLINHLKQLNWEFTKTIEVGDPHELELSSIQSSNHETVNSSNNHTSSLRFAKPKGPRRR